MSLIKLFNSCFPSHFLLLIYPSVFGPVRNRTSSRLPPDCLCLHQRSPPRERPLFNRWWGSGLTVGRSSSKNFCWFLHVVTDTVSVVVTPVRLSVDGFHRGPGMDREPVQDPDSHSLSRGGFPRGLYLLTLVRRRGGLDQSLESCFETRPVTPYTTRVSDSFSQDSRSVR